MKPVLITFTVLMVGCSSQPGTDAGASFDAGLTNDAGSTADAGTTADAGFVCPNQQSGVDLVPTMDSAPACADALAAPTTLTYAPGANHQLDLRVPRSGAAPFPTVIWIHGGGWRMGSRADVQQAARLVCRGYAVASIDYRLTTTAPFPAQIHDVKAAIRHLRANAPQYQLDPQRFAAFGSSAGGHLSALATTSGGVADLEDLTLGNPTVSSAVQAGVAWFAPTDLSQMDAQLLAQGCAPGTANHGNLGSPESDLVGCAVSSPGCAAAIRRANPITYVGPGTPPLSMLHGSVDCTVPNAQTTLLMNAMDSAGRCASKRSVVGASHGGPEFQSSAVQADVRAFLDAIFKP